MNYFYLGTDRINLPCLCWQVLAGMPTTPKHNDYMIGGGNMSSTVMALSYGATFISASAIVGFGGVSAAYGMGIQWLCMLNILVGVIIAFIFFGKKTRRLGAELQAKTFPQLLGSYFQSKSIQVIAATVILLGMPLYAAVVMKGGAVFIEQIFSINYNIALLIFTLITALYVISGGMKGVMYTSAFQAVVMFVCMFVLLFGLYKALGMGFSEANRALDSIDNLVPSIRLAGSSGLGQNACIGITSMVHFGHFLILAASVVWLINWWCVF